MEYNILNTRDEISKLLDLENPTTLSNWMSWDKGDCSKVGIIRILLIQEIGNEIRERGNYYDGCYDKLLESLNKEYNT